MNTRRRQRTTDLTFGAWNVQTKLQPGKMKIGINEWRDRARDREAYCKEGQGPPRDVAPPKKNKFQYFRKNIGIANFKIGNNRNVNLNVLQVSERFAFRAE